LKGTRNEAEQISKFLPKEEYEQLLGFAANRTILADQKLSQYHIVHFATHGVLNEKNPELSGIVLSLYDKKGEAQDGFLYAHEIYNLKLGADLVVLSACQTALGKEVRGEGLISLTRGFMYAGAPRVVVSLWKVKDEASAELMKHFYAAMIQKKLTPAAALRDAQAAMTRHKLWNAPCYWAGFILQGEWR
jgi:CHAT domain-containing protein